jgi:PIN domain nuclease of toxin-antitoxin system
LVIVDTHAALWFLEADSRLSRVARETIEGELIERRLSAVSVWEVAVKISVGKLTVPPSFYRLLYEQGLSPLSVTDRHARLVADLPMHHRDPFDRLLVVQAQVERMSILSSDVKLHAYDVDVIW